MHDFLSPAGAATDLSVDIEDATAAALRVPIEVPVHTSFGVMRDRPAVFVRLEDKSGNVGFGEVWCNFPACGAEHRVRLLETAILPALTERSHDSPVACFETLERRFRRLAVQTGEPGPVAQCIAGIDVALWDLIAGRAGLPLYRLLGGKEPEFGVYASGINPDGAPATIARCRDEGHRAFKLKIGFGRETDLGNIEQICGSLREGESLMVDANQAWSCDEALEEITELADYPLVWLEEPILADSSPDSWKALVDRATMPLAGGENIIGADGFHTAIKGGWLQVIQPDVCKWGGISGCLPVAKSVLSAGKRYCPHFLGGGIGLAASAHLLAAVGGDGLLEIDVNPNPLRSNVFAPRVNDGRITLGDRPGLGIDRGTIEELMN